MRPRAAGLWEVVSKVVAPMKPKFQPIPSRTSATKKSPSSTPCKATTPAGPDRCAVKVGVAARAGQGEPAVLLKFESTLPEGDLQRSIVRVIPHQQIADL